MCAAPAARSPAPVGPWSPLRVPMFRSLWLAALVANLGTFTFVVAAGWTMTDLADSSTLVGLVQTAWAVPGLLIALPAGAWADATDRRRVLVVANTAAMTVALLLAVVTLAGELTPTVLLAATFLQSVALTVGSPAYMAITPRLVDADLVGPAIGLDAIARNLGQSVGPAIGGLLIAAAGPGAVFALNGLAFVGILVAVRRLPDAVTAATAEQSQVWRSVRSGAAVVFGSAAPRRLVARLAAFAVFSAAVVALLPVVARSAIGSGSDGFGVIAGSLGVGSVTVLQVMPRLRRHLSLEAVLLTSALVWTAGALLLGVSGSLPVACAAAFVAGAGAMATLNAIMSTYLMALPDEARGRGAAFAIMGVWGGTSIGSLVWGALADAVGLGPTIVGAALGNAALALIASVVWSVGERGGDRRRRMVVTP